jgi:hypothetical protein
MQKNKQLYVVLLGFIKDFFCNKYVDVIWCCTFKFGLYSYYRDDKTAPPASCVTGSSSSPQNGWHACNTTTFCVTFMVPVSVVRSRNKPSASRLYLQQVSWVTITIPLPPNSSKIKQNYFQTHSKELGPWISTLRKHYTYKFQTVMFYVTCVFIKRSSLWTEESIW